MPILYRKTPKGQAEMDRRTLPMTPRLRGLLILVDGRRDSAALAQLVGTQTEEALRALAAEGFIEAVPGAGPHAPLNGHAAAPASAPAPLSVAGFEARRREAARALTDLIGPSAEPLAIRIERAPSPEALRPLIALAQQSIANLRGARSAADYGGRFGV